MRASSPLLLACLTSALALTGPLEADVIDVPPVKDVTIDGRLDDWRQQGTSINVRLPIDGSGAPPADDLAADVRIGWDANGLVLALSVTDDQAVPDPRDNRLWRGDCVHLYVARLRGADDSYQVLLSPGRGAGDSKLRTKLGDKRTDRWNRQKLAVESASTVQDDGYTLEIHLPWSNSGVTPAAGRELALQIYVADTDPDRPGKTIGLSPRRGGTGVYRRIILRDPRQEVADRPPVGNAAGRYVDVRRTELTVSGLADLADHEITVRDGDSIIARTKPEAREGYCWAELTAPFPAPGQTYEKLDIYAGPTLIDTVRLPDARPIRARMLLETQIIFDPYVFTGAEFPDCDFANPHLAELLLGSYEVRTTFYDADGDRVQRPLKPGRYGAVIDITPRQGRPMRRLRTLLRLPDRADFGREMRLDHIGWPQGAGFDSQAVDRFAEPVGEWVGWQVQRARRADVNAAGVLAAMLEAPQTDEPLSAWNDPAALDRQYWVELKRRITGNAERFPGPLEAPREIQGPPARTLEPGSPAQAGMSEAGIAALDELLAQWASQSDQAFAVAVARRGTLVLHKAYGTRDGKPMTVDTPSWMASITKMIGGVGMMMLVDRQLVELDDPVSKFLPAFDDSLVETPLRIRHCYTHTSGLWGHWGDDRPDHEHLVAYYYPLLPVAKYPSYNGADNAIGGKIIEQVSGLAMPQFYHKHLLEPLGCTGTTIRGTFGDATSTPLDMARIGQMLLNGGAYGSKRFMKPETVEAMRPASLEPILGYQTKARFGIGTMVARHPRASEQAYGHGAASAATFIIDPPRDLVIVMTRDSRGDVFDRYHGRFVKAVYDAIQP
jgi:CubicO group peptidase (beta-lactamase class C family)